MQPKGQTYEYQLSKKSTSIKKKRKTRTTKYNIQFVEVMHLPDNRVFNKHDKLILVNQLIKHSYHSKLDHFIYCLNLPYAVYITNININWLLNVLAKLDRTMFQPKIHRQNEIEYLDMQIARSNLELILNSFLTRCNNTIHLFLYDQLNFNKRQTILQLTILACGIANLNNPSNQMSIYLEELIKHIYHYFIISSNIQINLDHVQAIIIYLYHLSPFPILNGLRVPLLNHALRISCLLGLHLNYKNKSIIIQLENKLAYTALTFYANFMNLICNTQSIIPFKLSTWKIKLLNQFTNLDYEANYIELLLCDYLLEISNLLYLIRRIPTITIHLQHEIQGYIQFLKQKIDIVYKKYIFRFNKLIKWNYFLKRINQIKLLILLLKQSTILFLLCSTNLNNNNCINLQFNLFIEFISMLKVDHILPIFIPLILKSIIFILKYNNDDKYLKKGLNILKTWKTSIYNVSIDQKLKLYYLVQEQFKLT